jgi:hypothetical protein
MKEKEQHKKHWQQKREQGHGYKKERQRQQHQRHNALAAHS